MIKVEHTPEATAMTNSRPAEPSTPRTVMWAMMAPDITPRHKMPLYADKRLLSSSDTQVASSKPISRRPAGSISRLVTTRTTFGSLDNFIHAACPTITAGTIRNSPSTKTVATDLSVRRKSVVGKSPDKLSVSCWELDAELLMGMDLLMKNGPFGDIQISPGQISVRLLARRRLQLLDVMCQIADKIRDTRCFCVDVESSLQLRFPS